MTISIIIPTYNEAENIGGLITYLQQHANDTVAEIIVSDGGSTDATVCIAGEAGANVIVSPKGRAVQMNRGASEAQGNTLYFIHADTFPPPTFCNDIAHAINEGYELGRYKTKFLSGKHLLRLNEWFTRFDLFICMGGDQTLFVSKKLFERAGGFRQDMLIMEEYEFCKRARETGRYKILNGAALVSARKYDKNTWWQVQRANYKVVRMYRQGASQQSIVETYKRLLKF